MRSHVVRRILAVGSAGLIVLGLGACSQPKPGDNKAQSDLKIVQQFPINAEGAKIAPPDASQAVDPAGDGKATCQPVTIAMAGALTGSDAALGINIKDGAQLAVDKHNAANPGCPVTLRTFDTEGNEQKATGIAPQIVDDKAIVGLIGPAFSGETAATGAVFDQAGLVAATASATRVSLSDQGWKTFFRGLGNDFAQGTAVANYLKNTLGAKKVCVIDDSSPYGQGLATVVRDTLGPVATSLCNNSVKKGDKDFSATVTAVKDAKPDAVFYGGYYAEAAILAQQLKDGGVTATFVSGDGSNDPAFVKQAGAAAKDALLSCPCAADAPAGFSDPYNKKFGQAPGVYSTQAYDLATIMLKGIDSGAVTRPALLDFFKKYEGTGVAGNYKFTDKGELTGGVIWIYKVQ